MTIEQRKTSGAISFWHQQTLLPPMQTGQLWSLSHTLTHSWRSYDLLKSQAPSQEWHSLQCRGFWQTTPLVSSAIASCMPGSRLLHLMNHGTISGSAMNYGLLISIICVDLLDLISESERQHLKPLQISACLQEFGVASQEKPGLD